MIKKFGHSLVFKFVVSWQQRPFSNSCSPSKALWSGWKWGDCHRSVSHTCVSGCGLDLKLSACVVTLGPLSWRWLSGGSGLSGVGRPLVGIWVHLEPRGSVCFLGITSCDQMDDLTAISDNPSPSCVSRWVKNSHKSLLLFQDSLISGSCYHVITTTWNL